MEQTMTTRHEENAFLALNRICLNNWHYITRKILSFHREINFFTGHSGSGKSTVIDALQLVLYANTDGRGFFNKAAADDSDRSLIEYLRGMVTIGENNEFSYLRNQNFSSTIVLELLRTDTGDRQCVGIVFDVDTATNDISRRFFWHKGPLWENGYRKEKRTMSIQEVEEALETGFGREDFFCTSHNERFRRVLYDCYLGGLDSEKFPQLFKRAIPFRMNIKLEDFVKEYICTEQDIHIEEMQESVMQYGRMRQKIEETCRELEELGSIREAFLAYEAIQADGDKHAWFSGKLELLELKAQREAAAARLLETEKDLKRQEEARDSAEEQIRTLSARSDDLLRRISSTGYEEQKSQLDALSELLEHLEGSEAKWQRAAAALKQWEEEEITSNQTLWDIEEFEKRTAGEEVIDRLKRSLAAMKEDAERQRQEAASSLNELKRREKQAREELEKLGAGSKAYPKYLEEARTFLQRRLLETTGKSVEVYALADLLEVKSDEWRNAVEGYLGSNKLNLVVSPKYAAAALEAYQELDGKSYYNVSVLDTEKASKAVASPLAGALSEEVTVREGYLRPYIELLLGRVVKCHSVEELRHCRVGITPDCLLYHTFHLQRLNPDSYRKFAYIGKDSLRKRIRLLEEELGRLGESRLPLEQEIADCRRLLSMEFLAADTEEYLQWKRDMEDLRRKRQEKEALAAKLAKLRSRDVDKLEEERRAAMDLCEQKKRERDSLERLIIGRQNELRSLKEGAVSLEETILVREKNFEENEAFWQELSGILKRQPSTQPGKLREAMEERRRKLAQEGEAAWETLLALRGDYMRRFPNRSVPLSARENTAYDSLYDSLSCDHLQEYRAKAAEQAKAAVEHFKDDFIYKIRSAIKEALLRGDQLNRIISRLDFGKDKYQFVIGKNKGADGRYYDMFMDEALEVNPSQLTQNMEHQMNLFTMDHEYQYGELMNELISIFIPPENATPEQMEEAKRNMERYADYRTYLSFDMQQLIQNEDGVIKIRLSKMLKKNSGGEGQNPLYVALLASFAQAYRIGQPGRMKPENASQAGSRYAWKQKPSLRLVVLDEAFSKMDAEKVASCIELIRGLGFQAIISATNDKIQNYVENVDKTFVFANPNKKSISIQEFEKNGFAELARL